MALGGLWLAWIFYKPARRPTAAAAGIFTAGLGLDALYRRALAVPYFRMAAFLWRGVDEHVLNGAAMATASGVLGLSDTLRRVGSGRASASLLTLLAAAAVLLTWLAVSFT